MNENLSNSKHQLAFNCRKLKREKHILKTYSSNGIIHIVQIRDNKPITVFHQNKLYEFFPDFNFNSKAPKVAHESVRVIFHLPLKIMKECVVFYSQ